MSDDEKLELVFLRYYFDKVYNCLGPADSEIVSSIVAQFKKSTGLLAPEKYRRG